eukprot:702893-Prorocentrum_lima.AAC.1
MATRVTGTIDLDSLLHKRSHEDVEAGPEQPLLHSSAENSATAGAEKGANNLDAGASRRADNGF